MKMGFYLPIYHSVLQEQRNMPSRSVRHYEKYICIQPLKGDGLFARVFKKMRANFGLIIHQPNSAPSRLVRFQGFREKSSRSMAKNLCVSQKTTLTLSFLLLLLKNQLGFPCGKQGQSQKTPLEFCFIYALKNKSYSPKDLEKFSKSVHYSGDHNLMISYSMLRKIFTREYIFVTNFLPKSVVGI